MQNELENILIRFSAWSKEEPKILDWLGDICKFFTYEKLAKKHGEFKQWQGLVSAAKQFGFADSFDLKSSSVKFHKNNLSQNQQIGLKKILLKFAPWRKGAFDFFGVFVDSEWQSNLKFSRLEPHLDLRGKKVLDVGCSNGYYSWRSLGLDADLVVGIDPSLLFFSQFLLLKNSLQKLTFLPNSDSKFAIEQRIFNIPIGLEDMPKELEVFDLVFSMGVLYHRQSPMEHLDLLHKKLKKGGQLFLETLIIEGDSTSVLVPENEYAGMQNVWFLPSVDALKLWLKKIGFKNIEILDISQTSTEEQRSTEFMQGQSLKDFLNKDLSATKENLPPPKRSLLLCEK